MSSEVTTKETVQEKNAALEETLREFDRYCDDLLSDYKSNLAALEEKLMNSSRRFFFM